MASFDPDNAAPQDSGIFGLPNTPADAQVVLIPVPFEATTSYGGGTADGPRAVLKASRQVDLFDLDTGRPYEVGIAMLDESDEIRQWNNEAKRMAAPIIAVGGEGDHTDALREVNERCDRMNTWVYETTKRLLSEGKRVGLLGGDHSTPFGCIKAHAEKYPDMGILHLDAHADLRDAYEGFTWSHASIMFNVVMKVPQVKKLVQVGIRDFSEAEFEMIEASDGRIETYFDANLARSKLGGMAWRELVDNIVSVLPHNVYLSIRRSALTPAPRFRAGCRFTR
jgi:agmatinase